MSDFIWVDVYNSSGTRLGRVEAIANASMNRTLDGAGSFQLRCPINKRAVDLLQYGRRVVIRLDDGAIRTIGAGIIRERTIQVSPSGYTLRIGGPDLTHELASVNTLLGRVYNQQTLSSVVSSLITLVSGWSATVETAIASELIDARFDGVSVLKALRQIAKHYGYHIRVPYAATDSLPRVIELGAFGADSGLRIAQVEQLSPETIANPNMLIVQNVSEGELGEVGNVYNHIYPVGAGEGKAALTLEKSTRTSPYTISSETGPDGDLLYSINASSDSNLGETVQKLGQVKEIAPLTSSETDTVNAANALYDAVVAELQRVKDTQKIYKVSARNAKTTVNPGDKIRLDYKQVLDTDEGTLTFLDIKQDLWVLSARESVQLEGRVLDLEVSNIDIVAPTEASLVMDAIEQIKLESIKPAIAPTTRSYIYYDDIGTSLDVDIPVEFTDATADVLRVRMRIETFKLRANFGSAAGGGDHRHIMFDGLISSVDRAINRIAACRDGSGVGITVGFYYNSSSTETVLYTQGSSGTHTHDIAFGDPVEDTETPEDITCWVDGVDKTTELFGSTPIADTGALINLVADEGVLTDLLKAGPGDYRTEHTITFKCATGRGRVRVTLEIFETTQAYFRA